MNFRVFFDSICPYENVRNLIIPFFIFAYLLTFFWVALSPTTIILLPAVLILFTLVIKNNINIVILLASQLAISAVLPSDLDMIFNISFAFIVLGTFSFYCFKAMFLKFKFELPREIIIFSSIYFIFAIIGFFSTLLSYALNLASTSEIVKCILYGIMIISFYQAINNYSTIVSIVKYFVFFAVLYALYSYFSAYQLGLQGFIKNGIYSLHSGFNSLGNSNEKASLMMYGLVFSLSFMMFGANKRQKYLSAAIFVFIAIPWILLNSRSTYVALMVSFVTLCYFHAKRIRLIFTLFSTMLIGYMVVNLIPLFKLILRIQQGLNYRDNLWKAAIRMANESPVFGKGFGFYDANKFQYMDPTVGRYDIGLMPNASPHNLILSRFVDLGIIGVLLQITGWIIPIAIFIRHQRKYKYSEYYQLYIGVAAIMTGMYARWFFETGGNVIGLMWAVILIKMHTLINKEKDSIKLARNK